jgi:hypothetical protein
MPGAFSFDEGMPDASPGSAPDAAPPASFSFADGKPEPESQGSGIVANVGAGAVEGGEGVLNTLADPFGNMIGRPLATVMAAIHDAIAPHFGGKPFSPEDRAYLLGDDVPQIGTQAGDAVGRAMSAPPTSSVVAATPGEKIARGATAAGVGAGALGVGTLDVTDEDFPHGFSFSGTVAGSST